MAKIPTKYKIGDIIVWEKHKATTIYARITNIKNGGAKERHTYTVCFLKGVHQEKELTGEVKNPYVYVIDRNEYIRLANDTEVLLYA